VAAIAVRGYTSLKSPSMILDGLIDRRHFVSMTEREVDQLLVERVQAGEVIAFELLVKKYQGKLYSVVKSMLKDEDEAKDVVQEAFLKAYRAIGKFRGEAGFYTWIYRITVNTAKNYLVSRNKRPTASGLDVYEVDDFGFNEQLRELATPEARLSEGDMAKVIQNTLDKMPDELRIALTLREFDMLSYEAIAEIMACPIGTVRSRIFRAREAIEDALKQFHES